MNKKSTSSRKLVVFLPSHFKWFWFQVRLAKHSHCHPVVDDDDDDEYVYMRFVIGMSYHSWDTRADTPKPGAFYWVNPPEKPAKNPPTRNHPNLIQF